MKTDRMRVLVCGGRDYADHREVFHELDVLEPEFVMQGGATGADAWARKWCENNRRPCATFIAHWLTMRHGAGPARNEWMLTYGAPDLVLAFPGGRGTADMVRRAKAAGIEVRLASGGAKGTP